MRLWDWAAGAYARPGVPEACLTLQDAFGQNVSFLLWAWWAKAVDPEPLARAAALARAWDAAALTPLRAARRALKPALPPVDDAARAALREEIQAAELHAERVLLETLERLGRAPTAATPGLAVLKAAVQAWGAAAPDAALTSLAAALE